MTHATDKTEFRKAIRTLIESTGAKPSRKGLTRTPKRVADAYKEMFAGYNKTPEDILASRFDMSDADPDVCYTGLVLLRNIEFYSTCEHHLLPFFGRAHVGYVPNDDGVCVGISKLARLVDCYARRLQCQERLTSQVANALDEHLNPLGVVVVFEATHYCLRQRGVSKERASMTTSSVRGVFLDDDKARKEALALIHTNQPTNTL